MRSGGGYRINHLIILSILRRNIFSYGSLVGL